MPVVKADNQAVTSLTITLDALANGSSRQSAVYDNSTNLYVDVLVAATVVTPASGTLAAAPSVIVYVAPLMDGTHYTDGCTGADAAFTPPGQVNSAVASVVGVGTASQVLSVALTAYGLPFSVASLFGGVLPTKFAVWATNNLGVALGTGNAVSATPVYYQSV
jgi:hypothetical protein